MKDVACRRRALVRLLPLAIVLAIMAFGFAMGWHHSVTLEGLVAVRDRFQQFLALHAVLAVVAYFVLYTTSAALSLPGCFALTLAGGLLFGTLIGGFTALFAATLGATLVFLIAQFAIGDMNLADLAERLTWVPSVSGRAAQARKLGALFQQMKIGFNQNCISYLLFLRLVPAFPFWVVNLVAAVLGVPLRTYVLATFFGIIPATFAFASLGAGLDSVVAAAKAEYVACLAALGAEACKLKIHASSLVTHELISAFVLLGFAALIPVAYKKWRHINAAAG